MGTIASINRPLDVRSVFISDVHLGFPGCAAESLLDFLGRVRCEHLYLVGDIIDFWYLGKRRRWPARHNDVLQAILHNAIPATSLPAGKESTGNRRTGGESASIESPGIGSASARSFSFLPVHPGSARAASVIIGPATLSLPPEDTPEYPTIVHSER